MRLDKSGWELPAWPPQCCLYHLKSRASFLCPKYFWAKFVPTTYNEQCKIKWCSALGTVLSAMVSVLYIGHTNDGVGHSVVNNCIHCGKESLYSFLVKGWGKGGWRSKDKNVNYIFQTCKLHFSFVFCFLFSWKAKLDDFFPDTVTPSLVSSWIQIRAG